MESEKKRIEYTNGEIVVVWQPHLCIHSGICVHMLPEVYNPRERPWVKLENAATTGSSRRSKNALRERSPIVRRDARSSR